MIKVYYLDKIILFDTSVSPLCQGFVRVDSADKAKLELFSDSTKSIALISDQAELEFQKFITTFELIEAGGGVVTNPSGEVLMIFRNGRWDLPKGKLEPGEAIEHCAIREVQEECGVGELELGSFITHTYHIYELHGRPVLKRSWWWHMICRDNAELTPQTEEGITEVAWVDSTQMARCLENTYLTIKDVLLSR